MFTGEELKNRYASSIRPRLVDPPLDFPGFMALLDEYVLWLADVEDAGLDEEFRDLKSNALDLIVKGFRKGVGHLLSEIVRARGEVPVLEEKVQEYTVWEGQAEEYGEWIVGLRGRLDDLFDEGNRVVQNTLESSLLDAIREMKQNKETPGELNPRYLHFVDLENLVIDLSDFSLLEFLGGELEPTIRGGYDAFEEIIEEALDEIVRECGRTGDVHDSIRRIKEWELLNYYTEIDEMIKGAIRDCVQFVLNYDHTVNVVTKSWSKVKTKSFVKRIFGFDLGRFRRQPTTESDTDTIDMHFQVKDLELNLVESDFEEKKFVLKGSQYLEYPKILLPDDFQSSASFGFSTVPPSMLVNFGLTFIDKAREPEIYTEMMFKTVGRNLISIWFVGTLSNVPGIESDFVDPEDVADEVKDEVHDFDKVTDGVNIENWEDFMEDGVDFIEDSISLLEDVSETEDVKIRFGKLDILSGKPYASRVYHSPTSDSVDLSLFGGTVTSHATSVYDVKSIITLDYNPRGGRGERGEEGGMGEGEGRGRDDGAGREGREGGRDEGETEEEGETAEEAEDGRREGEGPVEETPAEEDDAGREREAGEDREGGEEERERR